MTNTTTIETRTYSEEEKYIFGFVLMNVLNFTVKPVNTRKEKKARYAARRFFGACKKISKAVTILESDSMTAQDVDRKMVARASFNKNMAIYGTYALSYGLPSNGRKDFDVLEDILHQLTGKDFQEIGNMIFRVRS